MPDLKSSDVAIAKQEEDSGRIIYRMFILGPERIAFDGIPAGNLANDFSWI